jgi:D-arabinose 1-dehydrogenase-like Zn-dependent alcohol dehydrogenase
VRSLNEVYTFGNIQAAYDRMATTTAKFRVVVKF